MALSFDYCLLRINPDKKRGECVNVGLVVFDSGGLDVRVLPSYTKAKALNAAIDYEAFHDLPRLLSEVVDGFQCVEDSYRVLQHIGIVELSELARFEVSSSDFYERAVVGLFNDLVVPPARSTRKSGRSRLSVLLSEEFRKSKLLGAAPSDIARHLIVPKFPIAEASGLFADFAAKNGVFHVTETIDFSCGAVAEKFKEAALKAVSLDQAKKTFGGETNRFVVYAADSEAEAKLQAHMNLLGPYADHLLNYFSREDMSFYMRKMAAVAGINKSIE